MWESERSKNDADSPLVTFVENCIGNYWELPGNGPVAPQDGDVEKEPYGPAAPGDTRQASLTDQEGTNLFFFFLLSYSLIVSKQTFNL